MHALRSLDVLIYFLLSGKNIPVAVNVLPAKEQRFSNEPSLGVQYIPTCLNKRAGSPATHSDLKWVVRLRTGYYPGQRLPFGLRKAWVTEQVVKDLEPPVCGGPWREHYIAALLDVN
jgi:hypothetical protein